MRFYFLGHLLMIALTAPWVFLAVKSEATVAGLPLWALYTIAASTAYALFVVISYARLWDKNADVEEDD